MSEMRRPGALYHAIVEGLCRPGLQAKLIEMGAGLVTSASNRRLRHQHRYAFTRILQSFIVERSACCQRHWPIRRSGHGIAKLFLLPVQTMARHENSNRYPAPEGLSIST